MNSTADSILFYRYENVQKREKAESCDSYSAGE